MEKPQIICHVEKPLNYTSFDCKWIPKTSKFVVIGSLAKGSGVIQVYEISTSANVELVREINHANSLKCGSFGAAPVGTKHLTCGDFAGNLVVWDVEKGESTYKVNGHDGVINCIDAIGGNGHGPPEIVTGGRDGSVKVWDVRQKEKPVVTIEPEDEEKRDCWAVTFGNSFNDVERVVCSGYDNGDVRLFDLRQSKLLWDKNVKNGVCSLEFDRKDINMNKLVVTTLEAKFHVFDCRTLHPQKGFAGLVEKAHDKSTVWTAKHLPQNRDIFMTTGGNGSACLWKYNYPSCRVKKDSEGNDMGVAGSVDILQDMILATQPIASFDWCAEKMGLGIATGFDQCLRLIITTKLNLY